MTRWKRLMASCDGRLIPIPANDLKMENQMGTMRQISLAAIFAGTLSASGCGGLSDTEQRAGTGAAIGAGGGAGDPAAFARGGGDPAVQRGGELQGQPNCRPNAHGVVYPSAAISATVSGRCIQSQKAFDAGSSDNSAAPCLMSGAIPSNSKT